MAVKQHSDQNSSSDELNKFNQLSQTWWDSNGPLKTLHQIQPIRLRYIREQTSLHHKKILDVGCGGGILTESLAALSQDVTGIDLAEDVLKIARAHSQGLKHPPQYICQSAEEFALTHPSSFDVITCLELIEHVPNPESLLKALSGMLRDQGSLFVSTLNRNLKTYLTAIFGAEYVLNMIPKGTHDYDKFIKPSELAREARNHGLRLYGMRGISYRPLTQDFVLTTDCSVNYIIHFVKD